MIADRPARRPPALGRVLLRGNLHRGATRPLEQGSVLVEDGMIAWIGAGDPPASARSAFDLVEGEVIAPAFIDLQVNGACGHDAGDGAEAIAAISECLPQFGVAGFLPTLISSPLDRVESFVRAVAAAEESGSRVLGAHVEGPFLNPRYRGAHEEASLLEPTPERVAALVALRPQLVTMAPELPGGLEAVSRLATAGVLVSAGHTAADYGTAKAAIEAGVRFGTHLFNAMAPFHHREPGVVGALLEDPRVAVGVIADGQHVHSAVVQQIVAGKTWRGVALTTDQTQAAGMGPGTYHLSGREVVSDGAVVRLMDGPLAGSAATMDELVRNVAALPDSTPEKALAMASTVPARCLGLRQLGSLRPGFQADLVVLDGALNVQMTVVGGRIAFSA